MLTQVLLGVSGAGRASEAPVCTDGDAGATESVMSSESLTGGQADRPFLGSFLSYLLMAT